ncbi:hypothetical protein [Microbacterium sp. Marseille-Q6965]|uniref:hypothetical protein n=1 Tax=Microbacterium sp. Marseille-Q6965 TaxID=2965072 RepID=UPI0021B80969|nr:hypothetical protein [Microbacterium sp. Marseille-Q6965]
MARRFDPRPTHELITVGLLMLVPLVYLVVAAGQVQNHALGAEAAARCTARAITQASEGDPAATAEATLRSIAGEYGMDLGRTDVSVECVPAAAGCPAAGATVLVTVRSGVGLPLVPSILGVDRIAVVPVEATSGQKVSRFWGRDDAALTTFARSPFRGRRRRAGHPASAPPPRHGRAGQHTAAHARIRAAGTRRHRRVRRRDLVVPESEAA